jgi:hypothetical protein
MSLINLPNYVPIKYDKTPKLELEVGEYLVVRKDGKIHFERYNGTGFAYNNDTIVAYYLPKIKTT